MQPSKGCPDTGGIHRLAALEASEERGYASDGEASASTSATASAITVIAVVYQHDDDAKLWLSTGVGTNPI